MITDHSQFISVIYKSDFVQSDSTQERSMVIEAKYVWKHTHTHICTQSIFTFYEDTTLISVFSKNMYSNEKRSIIH